MKSSLMTFSTGADGYEASLVAGARNRDVQIIVLDFDNIESEWITRFSLSRCWIKSWIEFIFLGISPPFNGIVVASSKTLSFSEMNPCSSFSTWRCSVLNWWFQVFVEPPSFSLNQRNPILPEESQMIHWLFFSPGCRTESNDDFFSAVHDIGLIVNRVCINHFSCQSPSESKHLVKSPFRFNHLTTNPVNSNGGLVICFGEANTWIESPCLIGRCDVPMCYWLQYQRERRVQCLIIVIESKPVIGFSPFTCTFVALGVATVSDIEVYKLRFIIFMT